MTKEMEEISSFADTYRTIFVFIKRKELPEHASFLYAYLIIQCCYKDYFGSVKSPKKFNNNYELENQSATLKNWKYRSSPSIL
ncbi:hypothetical protein TNIN_313191 [Trichonephila inaurata madagascariensis]|uniref:Uncharacterized protein n=1 Tax=Trichonephila inaurata madagascariensis TaxID=2747483 RepID=A0A8X6JK84_9ARAC|nr:hypothetical protein TNIN_313191 [Trichonephila inaurata madagascariensis]